MIIKRYTDRGIKCVIVKHPTMGHLCGYVRLRRGSRLYSQVTTYMRKTYTMEFSTRKRTYHRSGYDHPSIRDVYVHGGLTFCGGLPSAKGLWVGFDCAHNGDLVPAMPTKFGDSGVYRDEAFVAGQLTHVVTQLLATLSDGN